MAAWVHGCMDAWMCGCMDAWVHVVETQNFASLQIFIFRGVFFLKKLVK